MLELLGIDHLVLRTTQPQTMIVFYCEVLGCVLERELPPEVGLYQLRAGAALIDIVPVDSELGRQGGGPPRQDGRNMEHFCLSVAGLDEEALRDYLAARNVEVSDFQVRYGASGFSQSVYIRDPEGNVVELKLQP